MSLSKLAAVAVGIGLVVVWGARIVTDHGDTADTAATGPVVTVEPVASSAADGQRAGSSSSGAGVVSALPIGAVAGVPVGYPRTEAGAATAAVNWVASFPTLMRMGPLRLNDTLSQLLSVEFGTDGVATVVEDRQELLDGLGPELSGRVWIESPLQVLVESVSDQAASVAVWSSLVTGDPVEGPVEVLWRTQRIGLVWERDDWRLSSLEVVEGPTPVPVSAALASPPSEFAAIDGWGPAVFTAFDVDGGGVGGGG